LSLFTTLFGRQHTSLVTASILQAAHQFGDSQYFAAKTPVDDSHVTNPTPGSDSPSNWASRQGFTEFVRERFKAGLSTSWNPVGP
jgi:hypothetical protein